MRLIDADALIESIEQSKGKNSIYAQFVRAYAKDAPTIAPVRHGRWVVIDEEEPRRYGCSECKRLSWNMENYCGNCGARMDGEIDE